MGHPRFLWKTVVDLHPRRFRADHEMRVFVAPPAMAVGDWTEEFSANLVEDAAASARPVQHSRRIVEMSVLYHPEVELQTPRPASHHRRDATEPPDVILEGPPIALRCVDPVASRGQGLMRHDLRFRNC